ncbi:hypothetical protein HNQ08_003585 [Deinococcus humi]|uniref:Uncharacterized protein n=1 Tax=Deinococcus humi TaxID=662880 RepID=A0A7W8JYX4_9DEIO|nr:hypothetical protein [Deinococcus humi]
MISEARLTPRDLPQRQALWRTFALHVSIRLWVTHALAAADPFLAKETED